MPSQLSLSSLCARLRYFLYKNIGPWVLHTTSRLVLTAGIWFLWAMYDMAWDECSDNPLQARPQFFVNESTSPDFSSAIKVKTIWGVDGKLYIISYVYIFSDELFKKFHVLPETLAMARVAGKILLTPQIWLWMSSAFIAHYPKCSCIQILTSSFSWISPCSTPNSTRPSMEPVRCR